jgi:hypothetical protein
MRTLHRFLVIATAAVLVAALGGCASSAKPHGGQTSKAAQAALSTIPGVTDTHAVIESSYSGFNRTYTPTVSITIAPGFTVADPTALTDYLIRTAWSLNEHQSTLQISVSVIGADADLGTAAVQGGWLSERALTSLFSRSESPDLQHLSLFTDQGSAKSKLGAWPGKVPTLPDGVLVKK